MNTISSFPIMPWKYPHQKILRDSTIPSLYGLARIAVIHLK